MPTLDTVFAEWLHIEGASGEIRRTDANREAVQSWVVENAPALEVLPLINNYDGETGVWNGQDQESCFRRLLPAQGL